MAIFNRMQIYDLAIDQIYYMWKWGHRSSFQRIRNLSFKFFRGFENYVVRSTLCLVESSTCIQVMRVACAPNLPRYWLSNFLFDFFFSWCHSFLRRGGSRQVSVNKCSYHRFSAPSSIYTDILFFLFSYLSFIFFKGKPHEISRVFDSTITSLWMDCQQPCRRQ